jgi:hypothetical protein
VSTAYIIDVLYIIVIKTSFVEIIRELVKVEEGGPSVKLVSNFSVVAPASHQSAPTPNRVARNGTENISIPLSNRALISLTFTHRPP